MQKQEYQFAIFPHTDRAGYEQLVAHNFTWSVPADVLARRQWWCYDNPNGGAFAAALHQGKVVATCYLAGRTIWLN
ncbi:hypothetical protein, partial [Acinetobacter baumannii]|uniref:hypothetical protein n=1 Tax=Acinetobacter baumannii TaxID=470 RepID=UPI001BB464D3